MRRLHDSIITINKDFLDDVELCTLLTTFDENLHAVSHFEHETFTVMQCSQYFGTDTETAIKELIEKYRPVRQRTVRGESIKYKGQSRGFTTGSLLEGTRL